MAIVEKIRERAKSLLASGEVEAVIGFQNGTIIGVVAPFVACTPEDAEKLVWNPLCKMNLANFLHRFKGKKTAIFAKGCDSRSIGVAVAEKQLERKDIRILGVPCDGMISRKKLEEKFGALSELKEFSIVDGTVAVKNCDGNKKDAPVADLLHAACLRCMHRNPIHYDEMLGDEVAEVNDMPAHFAITEKFAQIPDAERWQQFSKMFLKCIRCYACRQACPTCYCDECFVDSRFPHWLDRGLHPTDVLFWHIGRVYHQAGRCVECGNCSEVCPVGIDFEKVLAHQAKMVWERYKYDAGIGVEEPPPLQNFKTDDPQEYFM